MGIIEISYMTDNNQSVSDRDFVAISYVFDGQDTVIPHLIVNDVEEEIEQSPLNPHEQKRLAECEAEIEDALGAGSTIGYRLRIIKTEKLFREKYSSFAKYCQGEWGICRFHANRLINTDRCMQNLKNAHQIGAPIAVPAKDSHARPLIDLTEEQQVEVAKIVKKGGGKRKKTAEDWEKAREKLYPTKPTAKSSNAEKDMDPKVEDAKVVQMPVQTDESGMVLVQLPSDYLKPKSKLPTLHELHEMASTLRCIKDDSRKKNEANTLAMHLVAWLEMYADWEQKFLIPGPEKQAQAA